VSEGGVLAATDVGVDALGIVLVLLLVLVELVLVLLLVLVELVLVLLLVLVELVLVVVDSVD